MARHFFGGVKQLRCNLAILGCTGTDTGNGAGQLLGGLGGLGSTAGDLARGRCLVIDSSRDGGSNPGNLINDFRNAADHADSFTCGRAHAKHLRVDLARCLCSLPRQELNLRRNYSEAPPCCSSVCRFDASVQGKQICLIGNALYLSRNNTYLLCTACECPHHFVSLSRNGSSPCCLLGRMPDSTACFGHRGRQRVSCDGHGAHRGRCLGRGGRQFGSVSIGLIGRPTHLLRGLMKLFGRRRCLAGHLASLHFELADARRYILCTRGLLALLRRSADLLGMTGNGIVFKHLDRPCHPAGFVPAAQCRYRGVQFPSGQSRHGTTEPVKRTKGISYGKENRKCAENR